MAKNAVAPSFSQQLGPLYKRWTLDCMVEIAHAVALQSATHTSRYRGNEISHPCADKHVMKRKIPRRVRAPVRLSGSPCRDQRSRPQ